MAAIWSDLEWSGCSVQESQPFNIRTTFNQDQANNSTPLRYLTRGRVTRPRSINFIVRLRLDLGHRLFVFASTIDRRDPASPISAFNHLKFEHGYLSPRCISISNYKYQFKTKIRCVNLNEIHSEKLVTEFDLFASQ